MPPSPAAYHHDTEPTDLSDRDVKLLHEILLRAQHSHDVQTRPKRALFESYEAVFADAGLDTKQDRACLRIILQLGDPRLPGLSLYDKFEHVLRQIGVNLAFGDDEPEQYHEQQHTAVGAYQDDESIEKATFLQTSPRRPRRRASFTSMHDVTVEQTQATSPRRVSRASASQLQDERQSLSSPKKRSLSTNTVRKPHSPARRISHESWNTKWDGMKAVQDGPLPTSNSQSTRKARESSKDVGPGSLRHVPGNASKYDEIEPQFQESHRQAVFYRPSTADLDRDGEAFEEMRLRNLQRKAFDHWRRLAKKSSEHYQALELQAISKDFFTLKRQALDFWRTALDQKRQQAREERFFEHLYKRAGRAYDLYLLTKSFTHWTQVAAAAVHKNNAARQRLLFTKYFNAWHQFTVTNELKAERQSLRASFHFLRRHAAKNYRDEVDALEVYHGNLTKYREQQLQSRTFRRWRQIANQRRDQVIQVQNDYVHRSIQNVFRVWATKTRIAFRKRHLVEKHLMQWHTEAKLRPAMKEVSRMRDWKLVRSKFSTWQLRTRMVFRADAVSRMRTLQNAYSTWNERLRTEALMARIDGRIMAEALYRWVIAQRYALMHRMSVQYRKKNAMRSFLVQARERREVLASKEREFVDTKGQQQLRSIFSRWRDRQLAIQARSHEALEFSITKLKQDTIEAIRLKVKWTQKMDSWAQDARFYFRITRYLAIWRLASTETKKARERSAHAKMRRQCKMNLARNVLHTWLQKRRKSVEDGRRGDEVYRQKISVLQQRLFRDWQLATSHQRQLTTQMSARYDRGLVNHCLGLMIETSRHLNVMQDRAGQFYRLKSSEICSGQLRKLSMRAFEMRRREEDADVMHRRRSNKHIRIMLHHWASKVQKTSHQNLAISSPSERPLEREPTDAGYGTASNEDQPTSTEGHDLGVTHRAEEWTAFDTDLLEGSDWISPLDEEPAGTSTPMPARGYLNTPSKRATRAKALASLSTTTPATPIRTPFLARLKPGSASSPNQARGLVTRRSGLGFRSALGLQTETPRKGSLDEKLDEE